MVSMTVSQLGHTAVTAKDGVEGLEQLAANDIAMIITDVNMPRMDGIEFVRQARATPQGRLIPIVMLTTESQPEMKQAGKAAGATGWIVKPFTRDQLTMVVTRLMR